MGHDLRVLTNHNLNISSLETLAYDLLERLEVNIEYGYYSSENLCKILDEKITSKYIKIETLIKADNYPRAQLLDENYQQKKAIEKYGTEIMKNPLFWNMENFEPDAEYLENRKKELQYNEYEFSVRINFEWYHLYIYNHLFDNSIAYIGRWWEFCRFFRKGNDDPFYNVDNLNKFRTSIQYYMEKLGGTKTYYLDDQSDVLDGVGQGNEVEMTWQEVDALIQEKTANILLNIPIYFTNEAYKNKFYNSEEYPFAFVDDFSDLK
jgi:hypothetical protein